MKRSALVISLCSIALLGQYSSLAQAFGPGDNIIGLGLGVGGSYNAYGSYNGVSPLITAHFEHGLGLKAGPGTIGAGAFIGYKTAHYRSDLYYPYYLDYRWTYVQFGARASYHWNDWHGIEQLDTYAGVLAGVSIRIESDNSYYPGYSNYLGPRTHHPFRHDVFAGARWYFSDSFAAYADLGYGLSNLCGGLSFKF